MTNPSFSTGTTFNTGEPPPGQCPQYADDKEVHDNIPGDTDHMALNKEMKMRMKTKMSFHTHGRLVSSGIMLILNWRNSDKICDLLPEKNLQDEKFTEYVSRHCLCNPTDLSL